MALRGYRAVVRVISTAHILSGLEAVRRSGSEQSDLDVIGKGTRYAGSANSLSWRYLRYIPASITSSAKSSIFRINILGASTDSDHDICEVFPEPPDGGKNDQTLLLVCGDRLSCARRRTTEALQQDIVEQLKLALLHYIDEQSMESRRDYSLQLRCWLRCR